MKDKYTPGQDCGCYAYSESECGCGADWTPSEVHELRGKLERERALADRLAEAIEAIWPFIEEDIPHGCNSTAYRTAIELCGSKLAAWKEARSE